MDRINNIIKKVIKEATRESGGRGGSYVSPLLSGYREFSKNNSDSEYKQNLGEWVEINKNNINETSTSTTSGEYSGPIELGMRKWKKENDPFTETIDSFFNKKQITNSIKNNLKKVVGVWEKTDQNGYDINTEKVHTMNEDLAVWFGKKKKPKGSSQPKGPWVDICRKVDGKHPPCGRSDTSKGSYPKCRASGVAGKMSDSAKRSACQRKRSAERKDTQTGKGQKPIMVSNKSRTKMKESFENKDILINNIIKNLKNN